MDFVPPWFLAFRRSLHPTVFLHSSSSTLKLDHYHSTGGHLSLSWPTTIFGGPLPTHHYWCLFMWRARWSDLEKLLSHWAHLKGLTPVCLRRWRVSSSDRANRHSQPSHEHRYGFSPEREMKEMNRWCQLADFRERGGRSLEFSATRAHRARWHSNLIRRVGDQLFIMMRSSHHFDYALLVLVNDQ